MYAVTLAFAFAFSPSSMADSRRTLTATLFFATGGIVGWPFALALSLPFILEELFLFSGDRVLPEQKASWMLARWRRLLISGLLANVILVSNILRHPSIELTFAASGHWHRFSRIWEAIPRALEHRAIQRVRWG